MKAQYRKKVSRKSLHREFIRVLNGLLQLTERESEILAILMDIDANWKPVVEAEIKDILSTDSRKAIMRETVINKNNLTKYTTMFKKKGIIAGNDKEGHYINPMFMPKATSGIVEVVFVLDLE